MAVDQTIGGSNTDKAEPINTETQVCSVDFNDEIE